MIRFLVGIPLGAVAALGLFLLMHQLIELGRMDKIKKGDARVIDFVRLKHESALHEKKRELPKKQKMQNQPTPPSMKMPKSSSSSGKVDAIKIAAPTPTGPSKVRVGGGPSLGGVISDGDVIPLVRINPMYPRGAAQKGVEGWVTIRFDINTTGGVVNPRVIDAKPATIFNTAALRAIKNWKYKPRIKDGVAVWRRGVTVRLTFKLDKE